MIILFRSGSVCASLRSCVVVEAVSGVIEFEFSDGAPNVIGWNDLHGEKGSDKESNMKMNYN